MGVAGNLIEDPARLCSVKAGYSPSMTRTKEVISLEMKVVMRRWILTGVMFVVATFIAAGAGALLAAVLGRSSWLVNGIPYVAIFGCLVTYLLLISPIRRKYEDLKRERGSAPSSPVVPSS